jgi:hypothetical protein
MIEPRTVAVALLAGVLLSGCGGAPGTPAPAVTPTPSPVGSDTAACRRHTEVGGHVRTLAGMIEAQPVLPAAVALLLLSPREAYSTPGAQDPALVAALAEVVAAIDDLDAQGKALLPPDGNPAETTVQLDASRVRAALDAVDRLCAPD